jgi:RNA polymerase sigma-70 factor (ECF subfamily)
MDRDATLEALVAAARCGDAQARNQLLERLRPVVRALVRRKLWNADSASDVVQKSLLRIHNKFHLFRGGEPQLWPWVRRLVANVIVDHLRPPKLAAGPLLSEPAGPDAVPDFDAEDVQRLRDHLARLPERYQSIIHERLFEGRKLCDIARARGKSDDWARVTFFRALQQLRSQMRPDS